MRRKTVYAEQIASLQTQYAQLEDQAEAILTAAANRDDPTLSEDEQTMFDSITDEKTGKLAKITKRIENLERMEASAASRAKPVTIQRAGGEQVVKTEQADKRKAMLLPLQAHALYAAEGDRRQASNILRRRGYDLAAWVVEKPKHVIDRAFMAMYGRDVDVTGEYGEEHLTAATVDAADTTTTGWAAELVNIKQDADDFRELLRPQTIVGRIPGIRQLSFDTNGSMKIKGQSAGVSGAWVGEGTPIPLEAAAFDDITLTPKKRATIIAANNELLRRGSPDFLELMRDDMIQGLAEGIDVTFQGSAAATATSPAGIFNGGGIEFAGSGAGGLAAFDTDLKSLLKFLAADQIRGGSRAWLGSEAAMIDAMFLRDGNGNVVYPSIENGSLLTYPIVSSTNATADSWGLVSGNHIVWATELLPTVRVSEDATMSMRDDPDADLSDGVNATPVHSMFQLDAVAVRITSAMDWALRHTGATRRATAVSWSTP